MGVELNPFFGWCRIIARCYSNHDIRAMRVLCSAIRVLWFAGENRKGCLWTTVKSVDWGADFIFVEGIVRLNVCVISFE